MNQFYNIQYLPTRPNTAARCAVSLWSPFVEAHHENESRKETKNNRKSLKTAVLEQNRCSSGTCGKAFQLAIKDLIKVDLIKFFLFVQLRLTQRIRKSWYLRAMSLKV